MNYTKHACSGILAISVSLLVQIATAAESPGKGPAKSAPKPPTVAIEQRLAELTRKHAILHDGASIARQQRLSNLMKQIDKEPEIAKLQAAAREPIRESPDGPVDIEKTRAASQELIQAQRRRIAALQPDLLPYVDAKLAYRSDLMRLMGEYHQNPQAKEKILQHLK